MGKKFRLTKQEKDLMYKGLKNKFKISREEFDYYIDLGGKVNRKIDRINQQNKTYFDLHKYSRGVSRFETREDFVKRTQLFQDILYNRQYYIEENKLQDEKFVKFVKEITDDKLLEDYIIDMYNNMTFEERKEFYNNNQDIRSIIYNSDEDQYTKDNIYDIQGSKLYARMQKYDKKLKR